MASSSSSQGSQESLSPDSATLTKRRRETIKIACDTCRRRKLRCEEERPCQRCKTSNAVCETTESDRLRFPSGILPKKPKLEATSPPPSGSDHTATTEASEQSRWRSCLWLDADDELHASGSSSGLPLIERLSQIHSASLDGEDRVDMVGTQKAGDTQVADVWAEVLQCCPLDLLDRLVRHHLSYTETMWPILHCPSFLQHYLSVKKKTMPCTREFGALLMAISAIASRSVDDDPSVLSNPMDQRTAGMRFFDFARMLMHVRKVDLHCMQALFYLANYAEGLGKATMHATLVGQAVALVFAAGFHQHADHWNFDYVEAECRKRVFWAIYSLDKAVACAIGRPPMLRLMDCNVPMPEEVDDCHIMPNEIIPQAMDKPNVLQSACNATNQINAIVEHLILACNTPAQIYPRKEQHSPTDFIYSFRQGTVDRVLTLQRADSMLDRWLEHLPKHLQAPKNLDEAIHTPGDARFIQSLRLSIAHNLIRALVARERIAIELKERQTTGKVSLSPAASRAEKSCDNIIRLYRLLSGRGLLKAFGMQQIQHLAACGHTFLVIMVIYGQISATGIGHLEDTIGLLRSRTQFPSAARAADILRDMAGAFGIRLQDVGNAEESDRRRVAWLRMLKRKADPNGAPAEPARAPRPSAQQHLSDERWLEMKSRCVQPGAPHEEPPWAEHEPVMVVPSQGGFERMPDPYDGAPVDLHAPWLFSPTGAAYETQGVVGQIPIPNVPVTHNSGQQYAHRGVVQAFPRAAPGAFEQAPIQLPPSANALAMEQQQQQQQHHHHHHQQPQHQPQHHEHHQHHQHHRHGQMHEGAPRMEMVGGHWPNDTLAYVFQQQIHQIAANQEYAQQ